MSRVVRVRQYLGCWARERLKTEIAMAHSNFFHSSAWLKIANRNERLTLGSDLDAVECQWQDSSWLTVAKVFPRVGTRLLNCVWRDSWTGSQTHEGKPENLMNPKISVIIPLFGMERLNQIRQVINSFQRQAFQAIEILVVGPELELSSLGQSGPQVRKVCLEGEHLAGDFNKSAALNAGARRASSEILVFHDGDIVVPSNYVSSIIRRLNQGWEFVQPIRFLFCLSERDTHCFIDSGGENKPTEIGDIMQNFPGGSVGIRKNGFEVIGGFDEEFIGWGGEDLEFLDRARTLKAYKGHFAPAIHLWHPPTAKKASGDRNQVIMDRKRQLPVEDRIRRLIAKHA